MEAWTAAELTAIRSRDKRRVWLFELVIPAGPEAGTWRAGQTMRDVTDSAGRTWTALGGAGEVQGAGQSLGRRPREVTIILHGVRKEASLYARVKRSVVIGAPARLYLAWVNRAEALIVQPKLRFAGVVSAIPDVALAATDRATLRLAAGTARASRLTAPWDASPASHREFAGVDDPIYDRVSQETQRPKLI